MTVKITYVNTLDAKKNKEFTVSRFADYDSTSGHLRRGRAIGAGHR
jgi:hypothetical protein